MRRGLIAIALAAAAVGHACAGDLGGSGITFSGGGASLTADNSFSGNQTFSGTVDIHGNTTIGSQDGSKELTIGGGAGDTNPHITIDKDAAGSGQIIFKDQGAQRGQITMDSSEAFLIRTDSNQPITFGTNSTARMVLDTSGQLNLGSTITNGQAALNVSATGAMFSVVGSTATGSNALTTMATATPCASDSVKGVSIKICASNGTGCTNWYLLACPAP